MEIGVSTEALARVLFISACQKEFAICHRERITRAPAASANAIDERVGTTPAGTGCTTIWRRSRACPPPRPPPPPPRPYANYGYPAVYGYPGGGPPPTWPPSSSPYAGPTTIGSDTPWAGQLDCGLHQGLIAMGGAHAASVIIGWIIYSIAILFAIWFAFGVGLMCGGHMGVDGRPEETWPPFIGCLLLPLILISACPLTSACCGLVVDVRVQALADVYDDFNLDPGISGVHRIGAILSCTAAFLLTALSVLWCAAVGPAACWSGHPERELYRLAQAEQDMENEGRSQERQEMQEMLAGGPRQGSDDYQAWGGQVPDDRCASFIASGGGAFLPLATAAAIRWTEGLKGVPPAVRALLLEEGICEDSFGDFTLRDLQDIGVSQAYRRQLMSHVMKAAAGARAVGLSGVIIDLTRPGSLHFNGCRCVVEGWSVLKGRYVVLPEGQGTTAKVLPKNLAFEGTPRWHEELARAGRGQYPHRLAQQQESPSPQYSGLVHPDLWSSTARRPTYSVLEGPLAPSMPSYRVAD
eukprot:gene10480-1904_t